MKWCAFKAESLIFDLFKAFDHKSRAVTNRIFLSEVTFFLHACASCYELGHLIKVPTIIIPLPDSTLVFKFIYNRLFSLYFGPKFNDHIEVQRNMYIYV